MPVHPVCMRALGIEIVNRDGVVHVEALGPDVACASARGNAGRGQLGIHHPHVSGISAAQSFATRIGGDERLSRYRPMDRIIQHARSNGRVHPSAEGFSASPLAIRGTTGCTCSNTLCRWPALKRKAASAAGRPRCRRQYHWVHERLFARARSHPVARVVGVSSWKVDWPRAARITLAGRPISCKGRDSAECFRVICSPAAFFCGRVDRARLHALRCTTSD